ncbi:MAG: L-aspartate oxidase [Ignavibacteriaceae bacterium]
MDTFQFDFVIIGSGLAGLYSALHASKFGKVALITKTTLEVSNSFWAQGGIAAAIDKNDSPQFHFEDTIKAGRGLCKSEAVKILVEEGKKGVEELIQMGMPFDRENGKIVSGLEGGHGRKRILHAGGDATGREIVKFVLSLVTSNKQITIFENTLIHKLIVKDNICYGVYAFDILNRNNFEIMGNSTFINSGGASAIYQRSTNPLTTLGEGISLAYDAGAEIESMEFVQFHPTSFYANNSETFLISEAVRGEGAFLVNHDKKRFLSDYNISELAPRDIVSKAIFYELQKSGKTNVFLDLSHLNSDKIKQRFPNIYRAALEFEIDITKDLVPIAPAAHFMVGGIKTGVFGETNIRHLFSVGEAASNGVHGANRLASNSLLECIVFGKRAVEYSLNIKPEETKYQQIETGNLEIAEEHKKIFGEIKNTIAALLWNNVGIVRSSESLKTALNELQKFSVSYVNNQNEYFNGRIISLIEVAQLIAQAALIREESRGCHLREDYPGEDQKFECTIIQQKNRKEKFLSVN